MTPRPLQEALQLVLSPPLTNRGQQAAQREITSALEVARDAQTTDHREPGGSQRREMVVPLSAGDMRLAGDRAGAL
jgi:hypothetical protein